MWSHHSGTSDGRKRFWESEQGVTSRTWIAKWCSPVQKQTQQSITADWTEDLKNTVVEAINMLSFSYMNHPIKWIYTQIIYLKAAHPQKNALSQTFVTFLSFFVCLFHLASLINLISEVMICHVKSMKIRWLKMARKKSMYIHCFKFKVDASHQFRVRATSQKW